MKTLSSFILSFIIIIGIAACDSSTMADTQEGQRIGTWMVYDTEADWVGVQSETKAKSFATQAGNDTLNFNTPDSIAVKMMTFPESNTIGLNFYDSTRHYENNGGHVMTNNPFHKDQSFAMEAHNTYTRVIVSIDYLECDSTYVASEDLIFIYSEEPYYEENGPNTVTKIIKINADGIINSAKALSGCN